jgi:hypothetical protein
MLCQRRLTRTQEQMQAGRPRCAKAGQPGKQPRVEKAGKPAGQSAPLEAFRFSEPPALPAFSAATCFRRGPSGFRAGAVVSPVVSRNRALVG